jgi:PKD repeat protein
LTLVGLCLIALASCEKLPNIPPVALFVVSPLSPIIAGQTVVTFNASPTQDSDGSVRSFVWNFGDGTPEQSVDNPVITHVFPDTAARCLVVTYTVLLTAVDDAGENATASAPVSVTELPLATDATCPR